TLVYGRIGSIDGARIGGTNRYIGRTRFIGGLATDGSRVPIGRARDFASNASVVGLEIGSPGPVVNQLCRIDNLDFALNARAIVGPLTGTEIADRQFITGRVFDADGTVTNHHFQMAATGVE